MNFKPEAWTPTLAQRCPCPQRAVPAACPALQHNCPDQEKTLSTSASSIRGHWDSCATLSLVPGGLASPAPCYTTPGGITHMVL